MEFVILIEGNVKHPLTIDPSVWIFDDRKVDLTTYFQEKEDKKDEINEYTKRIAAQFDKEMLEGSEPPTQTNQPLYKKEMLLNGTFGMPIAPFIENAEPTKDAKEMIIETKDNSYSLSLSEGKKIILGFSKNGKPLKEDGPVHVYFHDGSNKDEPITNVKKIIIK